MNNQSGQSSSYTSTNMTVQQVLLPTQVIEKPAAIHEQIRKETIEEIQPVVNVEKLKTEIHQVTQPLFDKEVRPVNFENRTLATQVLPEVQIQGRGTAMASDVSTTRYLDTATVIVEKPALVTEIEKRQIIEEVQPVIYKETIVPTVIQETKPVYQKIVEGPVYSQETLAAKDVAVRSNIAAPYVPDQTVVAPVNQRVMLPTQVIEKPVAIHEEIRRETIEEIQPVVNVEKIKTEVHQITAPLYDKEVRPVMYEQRTLAQEILPEVQLQGRGAPIASDVSTTRYMDTTSVLVEKPAIVTEVERTQIIEEIQPVVYKETIVPTVIRETKPVYQKIVEGPVYSQQTLPARPLTGSNYQYPTQQQPIQFPADLPVVQQQVQQQNVPVVSRDISSQLPIQQQQQPARQLVQPVQPMMMQPVQPMMMPVEHHRKEIIEDTITTTTTTTVAPQVGMNSNSNANNSSGQKSGGLFHHNKSTSNSGNTDSSNSGNTSGHKSGGLGGLFHHNKSTSNSGSTGMDNSMNSSSNNSMNSGMNNMNLGNGQSQHIHNERSLGNGEKVVEDITTTTTHSQNVLPARRM